MYLPYVKNTASPKYGTVHYTSILPKTKQILPLNHDKILNIYLNEHKRRWGHPKEGTEPERE
jgi:hypothetical protein